MLALVPTLRRIRALLLVEVLPARGIPTPVNTVMDRQSMSADSAMLDADLQGVALKLLSYCRTSNWAGYDPYDALNSPIFRKLPLLDRRIPRLVLTQALKRSPLNLRRLLQIPKTQNPKAIALFLSAFVTLERTGMGGQHGAEINLMIDRLRSLRSPETSYYCWGYSFPWQGRSVVVPKGAPNLVCTTFVANALFEAFEHCQDSRCLNMALNAAEYIVNELYWTEGNVAGFSYPTPALRSQVHNANFLAAALLCRAYRHTADERFLIPALHAARYSAGKQQSDGSWFYGESPSQRWIDNFHTGYNLCALQTISEYGLPGEFDDVLRRGFEFYRRNFFLQDGRVTYFHDRTYPIDVHCVAQSIITLLAFEHMDPTNVQLARSVLQWALAHMWDKDGFFYYRILRACTNRLSYMRWSQAWMLVAIVTLLEHSNRETLSELDSPLASVCAERE